MKFIQEAYKGNNEWWTYLVTIFIIFIGWQLVGVIPLIAVALSHSSDISEFITAGNDNFTSLGIDSTLYLTLVILTFLGGLLALFLSIKMVHRRAIKTVITSREKIDWNRVFYAFGFWGAVGVLMIATGYFLAPEDFVWNFKPIPFLLLVLVSLFLLPIQTSMEELLFRGYLMQGFGTWFKKLLYFTY